MAIPTLLLCMAPAPFNTPLSCMDSCITSQHLDLISPPYISFPRRTRQLCIPRPLQWVSSSVPGGSVGAVNPPLPRKPPSHIHWVL
ncbi:hypothetical protein BJX96DRAFT_153737 [Aspergillus floccosus]